MGLPRFKSPKGGDGESSPHLYVANCGPGVGLSYDAIASVFGAHGEVKGVYAADESGTRVIVSYDDKSSAEAALKALNGLPCCELGGRSLHIKYSAQSVGKVDTSGSLHVSTSASDVNIPGLYLVHDFLTAKEEEELLAAVDGRPWHHLAKRRVQHYGYEFCYKKRNVDTNKYLGELPSFVSPVLERIKSCQTLDHSEDIFLDQLTVNEYPPGVGLSPHIDTHSAFEGFIFSISLSGPCIMEFRKYNTGKWHSNCDEEEQSSQKDSNFLRKAVFLPPRSMLLLSGEARYAWHHYIPHHKGVLDGDPRRTPWRSRNMFAAANNERTGWCCGHEESTDGVSRATACFAVAKVGVYCVLHSGPVRHGGHVPVETHDRVEEVRGGEESTDDVEDLKHHALSFFSLTRRPFSI